MTAEALAKALTTYMSGLAEIAAAIVIGWAVLKALAGHFGSSLPRLQAVTGREEIRLAFGSKLALGLEFLLAADILETAVAPTWNDIGQLAAIAVLRTGLNYFLKRELEQVEKAKPSPLPIQNALSKSTEDYELVT